MNSPVFLATLGQRPEAITVALDVLLPRYQYNEIVVVHTDPYASGIAESLKSLMPVLHNDYPDCVAKGQEIKTSSGLALIDISNQQTAHDYFRGLTEIIRQYRQRLIPVHLLVSGGRKAMSIYATVAATYLFGEQDRVWTVLTETRWLQDGIFHLPPGEADAVQLVELPLLPTNIPAGAMENLTVVLNRRSPRERFLNALTKQENTLAEIYKQHPYNSNEELGRILGKSEKTVENQLRSMYRKMLDYFDMQIEDHHKRKVLLDILIGRI